MDFAKLVTEYLNQRTEGDPSFIVSEESLAFVDLMRADDMDRRASNVESSTNSDARGEPSSEQVTSEVRSDAVSEQNEDSDPVFQSESEEIITTPASPVSDVALGGDQDAGVLSDMPDPDVTPAPSQVFIEDTEQSEPAAAFTENTEQSEPSQSFAEDTEPSSPSQVFTEGSSPESSPSEVITEDSEPSEPEAVFSEESGSDSSPNQAVSEDAEQSSPSQEFTEDYQPSAPSSVFTEDGSAAAPNSALQDEGVIVSEQVNLRNETTILEPPTMPDFKAMLQSFDRNYHAPEPPVGDLELTPEMEEQEPSEPIQSTTEFCEGMMADILNGYLATDRRGA